MSTSKNSRSTEYPKNRCQQVKILRQDWGWIMTYDVEMNISRSSISSQTVKDARATPASVTTLGLAGNFESWFNLWIKLALFCRSIDKSKGKTASKRSCHKMLNEAQGIIRFQKLSATRCVSENLFWYGVANCRIKHRIIQRTLTFMHTASFLFSELLESDIIVSSSLVSFKVAFPKILRVNPTLPLEVHIEASSARIWQNVSGYIKRSTFSIFNSWNDRI